MLRTLAHISDLHVGLDRRTDGWTAALADALAEEDVDLVLLTGDVTHRGRRSELAAFERLFAPVRDRLVVVPGNHDRMGDDVASAMMPGSRVEAELRPGALVVRLDSTAPHNRSPIASHGALTAEDIDAVSRAVEGAPPATLVVLMLHHHVHPLPEDHLQERIATLLGLPNAGELDLGRALLERLDARCDLVLHGHRHAAGELVVAPGSRPLRVINAGSTPRLRCARILTHRAGRVLSERWLEIGAPRSAPAWTPAAPVAA